MSRDYLAVPPLSLPTIPTVALKFLEIFDRNRGVLLAAAAHMSRDYLVIHPPESTRQISLLQHLNLSKYLQKPRGHSNLSIFSNTGPISVVPCSPKVSQIILGRIPISGKKFCPNRCNTFLVTLQTEGRTGAHRQTDDSLFTPEGVCPRQQHICLFLSFLYVTW